MWNNQYSDTVQLNSLFNIHASSLAENVILIDKKLADFFSLLIITPIESRVNV